MLELFVNSIDPDQMPCSAASDLGLHCLPVTHLGISSLQWVKKKIYDKKCLIFVSVIAQNLIRRGI